MSDLAKPIGTAATLFSMRNEINRWVIETFGEEYLLHKVERGVRLVEEALEFAQSAKVTREQAHALVDMVFNKPVEVDIGKEAAGVLVCLLAGCTAHNIDLVAAYLKERDSRWDRMDAIRERHKLKPVRAL